MPSKPAPDPGFDGWPGRLQEVPDGRGGRVWFMELPGGRWAPAYVEPMARGGGVRIGIRRGAVPIAGRPR